MSARLREMSQESLGYTLVPRDRLEGALYLDTWWPATTPEKWASKF